ncbi:MAG: ABC transporter substrate-binding protein [Deltaproteobacteria bacterium]|nr:ABC transporter substrate-binding protein [Deltaproteobacteria bacterium]
MLNKKFNRGLLKGVPAVQLWLAALASLFIISGCTPNDPYRASEKGANIFYTTFLEPPKHLDPARAYSSDEYDFIGQIYEPLLQYHYLKRPYTLVPLTAEEVPNPVYYGHDGKVLPMDAAAESVAMAVYEIKVRKGIKYQEHPAFARGADGEPLYRSLRKGDLDGMDGIADFPMKGSKELVADDFIYQIMRLADPRVESPVLSIIEKYVAGLQEFSGALRDDLSSIREERKRAAGASYNQAVDEQENPIILDYSKHPLPGVEKVDDHTFRIILKTKYPQFAYWLAMPFFAPVPKEAAEFYGQGPLAGKNITLDRFPIGTGPYMMETNNPNMEVVLTRNANFHYEEYPAEGESSDSPNGLLKKAGSKLPFIDRIVFKLEKEAIPRWNKFLQGYYDTSGITSDSFDQAVSISSAGRPELTEAMEERDIRLLTSVRPSTFYSGFNMLEATVGGYSPEQQKLRQAISIALDYEEFIEIFSNGRGVGAHSPLPPGIFGYREGREGINPFVYDWDETRGKPVRKSIEYAKALMSEAGYPGGRDKTGRPLVITFDNPWTGADSTQMINWYIKKFSLLGIQLENRTTDYNRFQEKMFSGNFQFFSWGWNADYPDPENFFFLLAGSNAKVPHKGENAANYANAEFDRLFKIMENMENGEARGKVIDEMVAIARQDAPWTWGYHPVAFTLAHAWTGNLKPNSMANNTMKYLILDAAERQARRHEWNRPIFWPVAVVVVIIAGASLPAIMAMRRKRGLGKK